MDFPDHIDDKVGNAEIAKAIRELHNDTLQAAIKKVGDENKEKLRPEVPIPAMVAVESSYSGVSMECCRGVGTPVTPLARVVILTMESVFILRRILEVILARRLPEKTLHSLIIRRLIYDVLDFIFITTLQLRAAILKAICAASTGE